MQSSRRDGREFFIHQLSNTEAPLRDAITRHIFERNDHISTSAVILELIDFLLSCFGAWEDLSNACKNHKNQKAQIREGHAKTYMTIGNDLKDSLDTANNIRTKLVYHLKSENSSAKDYVDDLITNSGDSKIVKIPTATLRELFIFNEAYGRREEIWRHVDNMIKPHESDKAVTLTQSKDLTNIVFSIFSKFKNELQPKKYEHDPKKRASKAERVKYAWLSQCIVLVLDTENRLILTGGSQLICHASGLFSQAAKNITNLRVGEEFAEIMDNCSKEFADRAIKMTKLEMIENKEQLSGLEASKIEELRLYRRVVEDGKSSWHDSLPNLAEGKPVLCWACEGSTFEFKSPCLRCQSIYPKWVLHKGPRDEDERKNELVQWIFSHLVPENPGLDMNWAYCAETVVASKLYLLHNGTLALV